MNEDITLMDRVIVVGMYNSLLGLSKYRYPFVLHSNTSSFKMGNLLSRWRLCLSVLIPWRMYFLKNVRDS